MYVSSESPDVMTITTSWVANVMGKTITTERWTLQQARDFFMPAFPIVVTKDERDIRPLFSFNIYKSGTTRGKQNVEAMTGVVFDFDNKKDFIPVQTVTDRLDHKQIIYFFYTSHSHRKEHPRWRLMIPFDQPLLVDEWNAVYDQMVILMGNPPGIDHQSCRDVAHIWFREKGLHKLSDAITLFARCIDIADTLDCPWLIENPVSTISSYWRKPDYMFHPWHYGDPYTKKTCLWVGNGFVMPDKKPVFPVEGSKMHRLPPSFDRADQRSLTPSGFAQAVFEANHCKTPLKYDNNIGEFFKVWRR